MVDVYARAEVDEKFDRDHKTHWPTSDETTLCFYLSCICILTINNKLRCCTTPIISKICVVHSYVQWHLFIYLEKKKCFSPIMLFKISFNCVNLYSAKE